MTRTAIFAFFGVSKCLHIHDILVPWYDCFMAAEYLEVFSTQISISRTLFEVKRCSIAFVRRLQLQNCLVWTLPCLADWENFVEYNWNYLVRQRTSSDLSEHDWAKKFNTLRNGGLIFPHQNSICFSTSFSDCNVHFYASMCCTQRNVSHNVNQNQLSASYRSTVAWIPGVLVGHEKLRKFW